MSAIEVLLRHSIDYAGLFPPAQLDMATAVGNYDQYTRGPDAWALGRFIVTIDRLPELRAATPKDVSSRASSPHWRLGVLAGADLAADMGRLGEFHRGNAAAGGPRIEAEAIEVKASSVAAVEHIMRLVPAGLHAYIEIPIDHDPLELIATIGRLGGRAKVRTGGVTGEAFPATADLIRFIQVCVRAGVPFKATAGLHHPLRAEYRLTYDAGSPSAHMFGFLNVLLTAAFLRAGMDESDAARLLEEGSLEPFQFDDRGISWRQHRLELNALQNSRQAGMISFGSCSLTEPIAELEALHLLDSRVPQA